MTEVVLIRPGATDFDEQNRIQGMLDIPLNARGQEQVQQLIEQIKDLALDRIYSSPSEPSWTTALIIGDQLGIPVKELKGLRNFNQGLWQGLVINDVRIKYPKAFKQWQESPENVCPPEGETISSAWSRIEKSLQKPMKRKNSFAIVVSEPIGMLIENYLNGNKFEIPLVVSEENQARIVILNPANMETKQESKNAVDNNGPDNLEKEKASQMEVR